jgi:drug/metabolite transporter (DMT)-like permease
MNRWGLFAGLAAAAIWGAMYVVSKVVMEVIPPFTLITLRLVLGSLTLWLIIAFQEGIGFTRRQYLQVVAVGWIGYGVSIGFQFVGTKLSTASNGALVTSATPAFVLLFGAWILGERITKRRLAALGLATVGVIVVIDPRTASLSSEMFWGNLSLVAAAITWALYSVLIRKVTRDLDTLRVSLVAFWGGFFVAIPMGVWEANTIGVGEITPGLIAGVLFLGIISTALAMYLWNTAFALLEAGVASLTFFAQPVVGTALGAYFLGERLTPLFLVGGVLIGLGIYLASER